MTHILKVCIPYEMSKSSLFNWEPQETANKDRKLCRFFEH